MLNGCLLPLLPMQICMGKRIVVHKAFMLCHLHLSISPRSIYTVKHPVDHSVERPVDHPVERPIDHPVEHPVEYPIERLGLLIVHQGSLGLASLVHLTDMIAALLRSSITGILPFQSTRDSSTTNAV